MQVTVFLDIEEVFRLSQLVPVTSSVSKAIARAIDLRKYWCLGDRDMAVECDDTEARELLGYAESYCSSAVAKIRRAFRLAHIRVDDKHHDLLTAFSRSR
jgi:hypothetical protein